MSAPVTKVLFVCLGNICRSPTAEAVFRHLVEEAGLERKIEIDSAGTAAYHIGKQPDHRTQAAARDREILMSDLKARQAVEQDFHDFDFILAMDSENLANLEAIQPVGSKATLQLFLDEYGSMGYSEVPDPYYGGPDGFELVLDLLEDGCGQFLKSLEKQGFK